jgi:hypothetical protein
MKKFIILASLILSTGSAFAENSTTKKVLELAPEFDKRIKMAYINNGNTVILQGKWPIASYFDAENVASGWCIEFKNDPTITNVIIANMKPTILGNARCKK